MLLTIIITVVISGLVFLVLELRQANIEQFRRNRELRGKNAELAKRINEYQQQTRQRQIKDAYDKGLYDGRETDRLYREFMKKIQSGERATVQCGEGEKR